MIESVGKRFLKETILFMLNEGALNLIDSGVYEGDTRYLLSNMIAKLPLSDSEYFISEKALEVLRETENTSEVITRSRLYKKFVFEHNIPCSVTRSELARASEESEEPNYGEILDNCGSVVIITKEEDNVLNKNHKSYMGEGWIWGGDEFNRYVINGIRISDTKIRVKGAIQR